MVEDNYIFASECLQRIALLRNRKSVLAADLLRQESAPLLADKFTGGPLSSPRCLSKATVSTSHQRRDDQSYLLAFHHAIHHST